MTGLVLKYKVVDAVDQANVLLGETSLKEAKEFASRVKELGLKVRIIKVSVIPPNWRRVVQLQLAKENIKWLYNFLWYVSDISNDIYRYSIFENTYLVRRVLKNSPDCHFAHVREESPKEICFFTSIEDALSGRVTKTTIGRYLTDVNTGLSKAEITRISTAYDSYCIPPEVKFAIDPSEIEWCFRNTPGYSCAKLADWDNKDGPHPAQVYASGDIRIAYILNKDGRLSARANTCISLSGEKCIAGTYGDITRLNVTLKSLGYKENTVGFYGLKLKKIVVDNRYRGCHIDRFPYFVDCGDFLKIVNGDSRLEYAGFTNVTPIAYWYKKDEKGYDCFVDQYEKYCRGL